MLIKKLIFVLWIRAAQRLFDVVRLILCRQIEAGQHPAANHQKDDAGKALHIPYAQNGKRHARQSHKHLALKKECVIHRPAHAQDCIVGMMDMRGKSLHGSFLIFLSCFCFPAARKAPDRFISF